MKYYNRILLLAMVAGITVSCADALFADYKTEKPESLKKYEYLNEYGDLKTYIDRISHPDFKLGTGVTVSDFLKQDLVYTLTVNNYDDVTAGNAMKYSSCVDAKGNMDFGTVKKFVKTAKETGISIYGHTLCWHSQQQNAYLNGLIADKEPEPVPGSSEIALHIKTSKPQANVWDWELYYDLDEALIANQEYTISVRMKASSAITFPFWPGKKDGTDTQYGAGTFSAGDIIAVHQHLDLIVQRGDIVLSLLFLKLPGRHIDNMRHDLPLEAEQSAVPIFPRAELPGRLKQQDAQDAGHIAQKHGKCAACSHIHRINGILKIDRLQ